MSSVSESAVRSTRYSSRSVVRKGRSTGGGGEDCAADEVSGAASPGGAAVQPANAMSAAGTAASSSRRAAMVEARLELDDRARMRCAPCWSLAGPGSFERVWRFTADARVCHGGGAMAKCEVCGNDYYLSFEVITAGRTHVFDSFECAIHRLAPICEH